MRILVVNAGSSSLKLRVLDEADTVVARADLGPVDRLGDGELQEALAGLGSFDAVGHRVVHGGTEYTEPTVVDAAVRDRLAALADLAPLHQPKSLAGLDAVSRLAPEVPAVACFDTAFHATLPAAAATYAIPADWRDRLAVRRYGFHGLSHAYAARRAEGMIGAGGFATDTDRPPGADGTTDGLRVVTCHLGAGASLAAVRGGRSVDTTMGFTPLEGLVMATRSGDVDPGAVLWLQQHAGISADEVADALEHRSGLDALAGTADMAEVVERAGSGDERAVLALDVYVHRLRAGIAAMAAALGGLDALVFTGGVGEHAPAVRQAAADGLGFLGVAADPGANASARPDADVTAPGVAARVLVVEAREDVEIARGVREALAAR
jgi:acetate kinase